MNPKDITLVVAVDDIYIEKLFWTYQTWVKFKPEILQMPILLICDSKMNELSTPHDLWYERFCPMRQFEALADKLGQSHVSIILWDDHGYANQREKMLTSLVFAPAQHVQTPWYLKLDADTFANASCEWLKDEWFAAHKGKTPTFIASPWGYTKPGNLLDILDDWGDTVEGIKQYPRLNIPHEPDSKTVRSKRMASWVMFGNTGWLREVVSTLDSDKLPVPSQDTFLYYMAARRRDYHVRVKMAAYGWAHARKISGLISTCRGILGADAIEMDKQ